MIHIITLLAIIALALLGVPVIAALIFAAWAFYLTIKLLFTALFGSKPQRASNNIPRNKIHKKLR